jgi:hypothetical protein
VSELPPRLSQAPSRIFSSGRIAEEKLHLMPSMRQVECSVEDERAAVPELSFTAPLATRELVFPDWMGIRADTQNWAVIYEGVLSRDSLTADVDGPAVRVGTMDVDGYNVSLTDPAGSFCQLGAEPYDAVQLLGCDPAQGDGQCGLGETCYVHPDAPASVTTGMCLPENRTEVLSAVCRDFLTTRRQYSASEVRGDRVTLIPRKRVLRTTPLDGCESDAQCEQMAEVERTLPDPAHPIAVGDPPADAVDYEWVCKQEPSRGPGGPDRCVMACESNDQCEDGHVCLAGYCYESTLPAAECVQTAQRYQVRASEAFVVSSPGDGYLHNQMMDPKTGECVDDPDAHPLHVGRIPLRPPPCEGDGMTSFSPNPCSVELEQIEEVQPFRQSGNDCVENGDPRLEERTVKALRLQNPALRLQLVDTETTGDAVCNGDRAGELPAFSTVYTGFELDFSVIGGFRAMFVPFPQVPILPVRILPAPDGRMWVMDEGDNSQGNGRVFTFLPSAPPTDVFQSSFIQ